MSYTLLKLYDDVMADKTLLCIEEKYIVSYILSWQRQSKCCFASNEFLEKALGISDRNIEGILKGLQQRNRIKIAYPQNNNIRLLSVVLHDEPNQCWDDLDIFEL